MQRILVIGAGGTAKEVVEIIELCGVQGVVGLIAPDANGQRVLDYPVLGGDAEIAGIVARHGIDGAVVAIGDNWRRAAVGGELRRRLPGRSFVSAVHPAASVSPRAHIGAGGLVYPMAVLMVDAHLGSFVYVSVGGIVGHDVRVGDGANIGPGAVLGGQVQVGDYTAIGAGAVVLQGRSVGAHAVIGAGAVVTRDVPAYAVAYGAPARVVRQRQQGEPYL